MASRTAKIGAAVGIIALVGLAFAGAANADDDVPDDEPDDEPPVDPIDFDPVDPNEPPPPPPDPKVCNFSGCGSPFDDTHPSPVTLAVRLQQLGYPINPAAQGWSQWSASSMSIWRQFQRDYNKVRAGNGLAGPVALRAAAGAPAIYAGIKGSPKLATDGLVGNQTIAALNRATAFVPAVNLSWKPNIVALA